VEQPVVDHLFSFLDSITGASCQGPFCGVDGFAGAFDGSPDLLAGSDVPYSLLYGVSFSLYFSSWCGGFPGRCREIHKSANAFSLRCCLSASTRSPETIELIVIHLS
jgi:hypothetical protein